MTGVIIILCSSLSFLPQHSETHFPKTSATSFCMVRIAVCGVVRVCVQCVCMCVSVRVAFVYVCERAYGVWVCERACSVCVCV